MSWETRLRLRSFLGEKLSPELEQRLKEATNQKELYRKLADQAEEQMRELRKVVAVEEDPSDVT